MTPKQQKMLITILQHVAEMSTVSVTTRDRQTDRRMG